MNTEHEMTDAKKVELRSGLLEPGEHADRGFIIPAGILIGLGAGILADHMGSGFLIGLGLGLVGSELLPRFRKSREAAGTNPEPMNVTALLIGAFLVFIGASFVLAPAAVWPYAIAGFLILAGVGILLKGVLRNP